MDNLCAGFASRHGFLLTESLLIRARAKGTKSLRCYKLKRSEFYNNLGKPQGKCRINKCKY